MSTEYISRDAAIKPFINDNQHLYYPFEVQSRIRNIPAADVVEVEVTDFRTKKAIQMLSHYYSVAKKSRCSEDPLSYALYMTWRITDEMSKSRKMLTEV